MHIISSYKICKAILSNNGNVKSRDKNPSQSDGQNRVKEDDEFILSLVSGTFAAYPAYEQLMQPFFPQPNLLLEDGIKHEQHKSKWRSLFDEEFVKGSVPLIRRLTSQAFKKVYQDHADEPQIDLYETMKRLAWSLLLGVFLGLDRQSDGHRFQHTQKLQEMVLSGQFSLFPVSVRTPFWTSARSRSTKAVRDLGPAIRDRLRSCWEQPADQTTAQAQCPFSHCTTSSKMEDHGSQLDKDDIVSHVRLFTSSIANKALASLLTAFLMNVFLWRNPDIPDKDQSSLAHLVASHDDSDARTSILDAILKETERLSPPVVGIMRRATDEAVIRTGDVGYSISAGHDTWLYFVAANRDPSVFQDPHIFQWDRFMGASQEPTDHGIAFGAGAKQCLGSELAHQICMTVAETMIESGVSISGEVHEEGVREWLGWQHVTSANAIARDMKQLPCQRPRRPILVILRKHSRDTS